MSDQEQDQERLLEAARRLLEGGKDGRDEEALEAAHPSDFAAILQHLPLEQQVTLFRRLSAERAGDVLPALDDTTLLTLVRALDEVEVSRILDEMPPEHAADVVEELPREEAEKILDLMEEERSEEIQEILEYPEDSAGRLMSPDVVAVRETSTSSSDRTRPRRVASSSSERTSPACSGPRMRKMMARSEGGKCWSTCARSAACASTMACFARGSSRFCSSSSAERSRRSFASIGDSPELIVLSVLRDRDSKCSSVARTCRLGGDSRSAILLRQS